MMTKNRAAKAAISTQVAAQTNRLLELQAQARALPEPRAHGGLPVLDALRRHHSTREYSDQALPDELLSDLLWAAFGVNRSESGAGMENREEARLGKHARYAFDPLLQELHAYNDTLPADRQIHLVALMWPWRDNYVASDWPAAHQAAVLAHNARTVHCKLASPGAADLTGEEGLSTLGLSCEPSGSPSI